MNRAISLFLFLFLCLQSFCSLAIVELSALDKKWVGEHKVLRVASVTFDGVNDEQRCLLLPCQYLDAFSKELGIELVYLEVKNEKEVVDLLRKKQVDLAVISKIKVVDRDLNKSKEGLESPYFITSAAIQYEQMSISIKKDTSFLGGLKDLSGQSVAVFYGGGVKEYLTDNYPNIIVNEYTTIQKILESVVRGDNIAAVGAEHLYSAGIYQYFRDQLVVAKRLESEGQWLVVAARSDYPEFISIFNSFLKNMPMHIKESAIQKMNRTLYAPRLTDLFYTYRFSVFIILSMIFFILFLFYQEKRQATIARKKEQEKAQFMAIVSHELRNPINTMMGALELLQKQDLSAEARQLVSLTNNASKQILNTLNDLLVFSKLDQKKLVLERDFIYLFDAVNECVVNYRRQADKKGILLDFEASDLIDKEIEVDVVRFIQVLSNLLSNAIKFTASGSVRAHLTLLSLPQDEVQLQLSVQDTGIGIALDQQSQLFKPFAQASSSTLVHFGGTGLGLAICKQLIELMQGEIQLSSELGVGTHLRCYLPVRIRPVTETAPLDIPLRNFAGAHVLIVEDQPSNQIVLSKQLQSLACMATVAANGMQALDYANNNKFDLILLDCYLPDITGYEVALRIRESEGEERHTPIIALSGATDSAHLERCMESKMDGVLLKPLLLAQLIMIMEQWIDSPNPSSIKPFIHADIDLEDLFIRSSQEDYQHCRAALAEQDLILAHYYAHRICGAARTMGLDEIASAAKYLEEELSEPAHSSHQGLILLLEQLGLALDQHAGR